MELFNKPNTRIEFHSHCLERFQNETNYTQTELSLENLLSVRLLAVLPETVPETVG